MSHQDSTSGRSISPTSSTSSDSDGRISPSISTSSDSDRSISPSDSASSDSDGSVSPSNSISSEDSWDLHHLGHVEAIPINHGGILKVVVRACVEMYRDGDWTVHNCNYHGPERDICFRIPGSGNNWIASITNPRAMDELRGIIRSGDTKGYEYHWYSTEDHDDDGDNISQEFIIESYLEGEKKERVPGGPEMIETLEERIGFMLI
ncbi:uncharacterized protein B0J16DRAFT_410624 [Fusarium flagelliforme]|uniref:Uncharacterized protein n=1 Tax=Fusarium flagelliforme TaxID=2675880 RepID=A0A395MC90_9HYPO|nr:uncharacterized protein B0J16DRAFT_410624 [Fusarium flagelliforme]KAH7191855.1 hypothetical protein B0J16DRAFT_410624 [Fusarium flagelliforme]RFN45514.1 hypothetical protein FIE12Z_10277 [Fusarium flagelliforme]